MTGFEDFRCASIIVAGIEVMHMIRKGQMKDDGLKRGIADQFDSLVTYGILILGESLDPPLIATQSRARTQA